jgi:hypothetical protein
MRPTPYIGITGFMSRQEVDAVLAALPEYSDRLVMIGVLASNKTIRWEENKWPKRYPKPDTLGDIFPPHGGRHKVLNLIHFNTKEQTAFYCDLCQTQALAGPHFDGFQLNMPWPDKEVLALFKKSVLFEGKKIVLQCGKKALEVCDHKPEKIVKRVRDYRDLVDYVLIDPSGGRGELFDVEFAWNCFYGLGSIEGLGYGIAGGLNPENLYRLSPLLQDFARISIDIETGVRDAEDNFDVEKGKEFLDKSHTMFSQYEKVI